MTISFKTAITTTTAQLASERASDPTGAEMSADMAHGFERVASHE